MALTGNRTYVGFGFGPIQGGLFLYEALQSGAFGRLVVAEVLPEVVATVRQSNGHFALNVAHSDRVEQAKVGPIEIEDPGMEADRERLIQAIAQAEEIGTSAWMAVLSSKGEIELKEYVRAESITGGIFTGRLLEKTSFEGKPAVIPEITGSAFITGFHQFVIDDQDRLRNGLLIGQ